jgi:type III pantothenate kinase
MCILLTIDSGNSFIKWGIHDGSKWLIQNKAATNDFSSLKAQWDNLPVQPVSIIISHVANQIVRDTLSDLLSVWSVSPHWVKALPFQCDVYNGYTDPSQLGCDRWMALIAARHLLQQSCLVINVGTAMTVDALSGSGQFLGGIIVPGPNLMLRSLKENTEQLDDNVGSYQDFPSNTSNAIFSGVVQTALGSIERMRCLLSEQLELGQPLNNCIISGGGAHILMPYINFPIRIIDNIVLEGLVIVAAKSGQS